MSRRDLDRSNRRTETPNVSRAVPEIPNDSFWCDYRSVAYPNFLTYFKTLVYEACYLSVGREILTFSEVSDFNNHVL